MDTETVIATLRAHRDELTRAGLTSLSVFGSVARGEAGPESDVDLVVQIDPQAKVDVFRLIGLEHRLGELLGRPVDLVPEPEPQSRLSRRIAEDRIRAF